MRQGRMDMTTRLCSINLIVLSSKMMSITVSSSTIDSLISSTLSSTLLESLNRSPFTKLF